MQLFKVNSINDLESNPENRRRPAMISRLTGVHGDCNRYCRAAAKLHGYLIQAHWNGDALVGPDPGIRFNTRVGRFIKSYFSLLPWTDNLIYMQAARVLDLQQLAVI